MIMGNKWTSSALNSVGEIPESGFVENLQDSCFVDNATIIIWLLINGST